MNATCFADVANYFEILEVEEGAEWTDVKRSYYRLAKMYHPDMNPEYRSDVRFKKIAEAFQILEKFYKDNPFPETEPTVDGGFQNPNADMELDEEAPDSPREETSFRSKLEKGFLRTVEYLKEVERKALLLDIVTVVQVDSRTAQWGGAVRVRTASGSFQVRIPPGIKQEQVMRIPGKGERGVLNQERGDLVLWLQVQPPKPVAGEGEDCYYQVVVTRDELVQRKLHTLETHEGPIRYTLPANTSTGQTFTLRSKSFLGSKKPTRHIIVVEVAPE